MTTYAERSKAGRDDEHMIYEMFNISQYEDGSVLDCRTMQSYTPQQVVNGEVKKEQMDMSPATAKLVVRDLIRNAKAALKHGKTENLAPRVG